MSILRGWLSGARGKTYIATDRGWFELINRNSSSYKLPKDSNKKSARVEGTIYKKNFFIVEEIQISEKKSNRHPRFIALSPAEVLLSGQARNAVDNLMIDKEIPQVMLPSVWLTAREYGEEELSVSHKYLSNDLVLLQSPEFPMYVASAMGLGAYYCWGRSYRYEPGESEKHLMEFEQIDIALSMSSIDEMMDLVEELVRLVAKKLNIKLNDNKFIIKDTDSLFEKEGFYLYRLEYGLPQNAVDIINKKIKDMGLNVSLVGNNPAVFSVQVNSKINKKTVDAVFDTVNKIASNEVGSNSISPWWRTPLPIHWESSLDSERSEYSIRSITSERLSDSPQEVWMEEAELYIGDTEIAHIGIFASYQTFLKNLEDAGVSKDRFSWLLPYLEDAPPKIVKVGIGWERLISTLLGVNTSQIQLFPRLSSGKSTNQNPT